MRKVQWKRPLMLLHEAWKIETQNREAVRVFAMQAESLASVQDRIRAMRRDGASREEVREYMENIKGLQHLPYQCFCDFLCTKSVGGQVAGGMSATDAVQKARELSLCACIRLYKEQKGAGCRRPYPGPNTLA